MHPYRTPGKVYPRYSPGEWVKVLGQGHPMIGVLIGRFWESGELCWYLYDRANPSFFTTVPTYMLEKLSPE